MERLPQEIIDQVIGYSPWLTRRRRAPKFVTVSRKFQLAIERHTFREICITNVELGRFAEVFNQRHRRNLLKNLEKDSVALCITSSPDQPEFSDIRLNYQYDYLEILHPEKLPPVDCIQWLLLNHAEYRKKSGYCEFSPLSYLALVSKLPCLKGTFLSSTEPGEFLDFRQSMREDFVQALNKTRLPTSMTKISFDIDGPDYTRHDPPSIVPNQEEDRLSLALRRVAGSVKSFRYSGPLDSCFFRPNDLAKTPEPFWQNMTHIYITLNPATPTGTWYIDNGPETGQEAFSLHLKDHCPPGYGTEEQTVSALAFLKELKKKAMPEDEELNYQQIEAMFSTEGESAASDPERFSANPDTVMPLLRSVTRAIAQMRSLRLFKLQVAHSLSTRYSTNSLKLGYYVPGVLDRNCREELAGLPLNKPRVLLRARGLRESGCHANELEDMFRKVSIANYNQEAIVTWI